MSFLNATEELTLKISGSKKGIKLEKEQYYLLQKGEDTTVPVIKHDALVRIADENGIKIDKTVLEFGQFNSPDNFCFIHRAYGTLKDGNVIDEVGEANPRNLGGDVASSYPAIMSNKRAQDRLLIRLMGLTGQVYSDVEFSSNKITNSNTQTSVKPESSSSNQELSLTVEEAKELIVDYGKYKSNPITLLELKAQDQYGFEWLLNSYKPNSNSSQKMLMLHEGAKLLANM